MKRQTTCHLGSDVPYLLLFVLLGYLAIVADSMKVPFHAHRGQRTYGDIVDADIRISTHVGSGNELGRTIPVYFKDVISRRSSKDLLHPPRFRNGVVPQNKFPRNANSQRAYILDSRRVASSATTNSRNLTRGLHLKSGSTSLSIISKTLASSSRPRGRSPAAEQILSVSMLRRSSNHSSSYCRGALNSSFSKVPSGLTNQHISSKPTSEKEFQEILSARHSLWINGSNSISTGNRRAQRGLRRVTPHGVHDIQNKTSRQLYESSKLVSAHTDHPEINISNLVGHWKAPLMENGPLITLTVAQGGAADFTSIQKAVDSVPPRNTQRFVIVISAGNYREKVTVPYNKPFITFHGDDNGGTVVSWNATASSNDYDYDKTKYETKIGRMENMSAALFGTMHSASVTILSDGFVAQHMTFQNSAPPPEPGAVGAQAVAFLVAGDRAACYYCSFLGAQDTLYDYTGRHYYLNCYIQGSIDFIFGNGRSLFEVDFFVGPAGQGCHLHSIAKSFGAIAAHQRLSPEDDTGFSFDRCSVTGSGMLYLGRAWSPYARIVFARTYFDNIISAEGWSDFGDPQRQSTTFFGQYQCTGPGANLSHRAPWAKLLTDNDVLPYLGLNFVNGKQWLATWLMTSLANGTQP